MTRDEHRNVCLDKIELAARRTLPFDKLTNEEWLVLRTAAFDALHGIARVCAVESTSDMRIAGGEAQQRSIQEYGDPEIVWDAMSAAGDLTNGPEKNP